MVVWTFSGLPALRASLRPVPAFIAVPAVALALGWSASECGRFCQGAGGPSGRRPPPRRA